MTYHFEHLAHAYGAVRKAFDDAHAAGLPIPPSTANAMAQLGLSIMVVRAKETGTETTQAEAAKLLGL